LHRKEIAVPSKSGLYLSQVFNNQPVDILQKLS